ncbi:hypothetical protein CC86DRAFT_289240 [Ophiobolus disseminans]|uniref:Uncharacterized protein n=1 Tax=Ophiobolus disseminans TaxID=1469910 RepID=A0A6A7A4H8_9PLEO|nr:hypothetical protein CC86DRAFT_289240 [Ophiobolus disseminans]
MEDPASIFPLPTTYEVPVEIPALHAAPEVHSTDASAQLPQIGGASSISDHTISVIDRMKYHLRCRTVEHVTFIYLNLGEEEANMLDQDAQYIDHDILVEASPTYARHVQKHPDRPIKVPKSITAKTVNAFSQIVSPVRAIRLPTHYLWPSKNSIPRVFDRFGAIDPEKINWSVGTLLELVAFARYMDILWMCDMAIDRLHWMFTEQSKLSEICRKKFTQNGWMNVNGRFVRVDNHLPSVPDLQDRSLSAKDFESDHLDQLFAEPVDVPTLMFVADLIFALGDESELISASQEVEQIFEAAAKTPQYSCLIGVARQYFCTRYHYHAADEACYTAYLTPTGQLLVDQAYTTESHDQLLKLSIGLAPANSLESIMYARTEDKGELQQDNSTPEMLEAEKQLLFMELQLEAAKAAMEKVRHAAKEDKCESLIAARNLLS